MIKSERLLIIQDLLDKKEIITVTEIVQQLNVSDMTVRRDLSELEDRGLLERVHGGARRLPTPMYEELSHHDKKIIHIEEKNLIAETAITLIEDDDIIFLGPGTTMEILASKIKNPNILIVTNCLPVFQTLIINDVKTYLIGGELRPITQAFVGDLTISNLQSMKFHKAFIGCNAVCNNQVMTSTLSEGVVQTLAVQNTSQSYLLIDSSKLEQRDFYTYCKLEDLDQVVIDQNPQVNYLNLQKYIKVNFANEAQQAKGP